MSGNDGRCLQVLICTYGRDGIERVARAMHPALSDVGYLVSWQGSDGIPVPDVLACRDDFTICRTTSNGLSKNRNNAFARAEAPLLLISDDDVAYTAERLRGVIDSFDLYADADLIAFRYESSREFKSYPDSMHDLSMPPKGYYVSSIEIAVRRGSIAGKVAFNENFGIGARFPSGEEDVFIKDCIDTGLHCIYLPLTVARHDGATTSERNLMLPSRPQTKGAVFLRLHPRSWTLRMLAHALREVPMWLKGKVPSPFSYCAGWIRGVMEARRMGVFSYVRDSKKKE